MQKARVLIPFPLHVYLGTFRSKYILISKHTPVYFCISQNALLFYMPEIPLMFLFISFENALSVKCGPNTPPVYFFILPPMPFLLYFPEMPLSISFISQHNLFVISASNTPNYSFISQRAQEILLFLLYPRVHFALFPNMPFRYMPY